MSTLTSEDIHRLNRRYPVSYDTNYYDPFIVDGRAGDPEAITQLTRWKNVGKGMRPMNLSRKKQASLRRLLCGLPRYIAPEGNAALRRDFRWRAPVWGIFWCHVLYGSPIFDRYTHMAWQHIAYKRVLTRHEVVITAPGHWELYDQYRVWFATEFNRLSAEDATITDRMLDRALFKYGEGLLNQ